MSENETLHAPIPGGPEPEGEPVKVESDGTARFAGDDVERQTSDYNRMVRNLAAQPKVRVRIPKGGEYVQLNGWKWSIPEGSIEVPQQVADLLIESGRI